MWGGGAQAAPPTQHRDGNPAGRSTSPRCFPFTLFTGFKNDFILENEQTQPDLSGPTQAAGCIHGVTNTHAQPTGRRVVCRMSGRGLWLWALRLLYGLGQQSLFLKPSVPLRKHWFAYSSTSLGLCLLQCAFRARKLRGQKHTLACERPAFQPLHHMVPRMRVPPLGRVSSDVTPTLCCHRVLCLSRGHSLDGSIHSRKQRPRPERGSTG